MTGLRELASSPLRASDVGRMHGIAAPMALLTWSVDVAERAPVRGSVRLSSRVDLAPEKLRFSEAKPKNRGRLGGELMWSPREYTTSPQ